MFGGYGVYARGVMFGLLYDDELFLKTDGESRGRFAAAGCRRWVYPGSRLGETSYYRPPDEAHEDAEAMAPWARQGLEAALRLRAARTVEAATAAARKAARTAKAAGRPAPARRERAAARGKPAARTRRARTR